MIRKDKLLKDLEPILMDGCSSPVAEHIYRTVCEQPEKFSEENGEVFEKLSQACRYSYGVLNSESELIYSFCRHTSTLNRNGRCQMDRCPLFYTGDNKCQ